MEGGQRKCFHLWPTIVVRFSHLVTSGDCEPRILLNHENHPAGRGAVAQLAARYLNKASHEVGKSYTECHDASDVNGDVKVEQKDTQICHFVRACIKGSVKKLDSVRGRFITANPPPKDELKLSGLSAKLSHLSVHKTSGIGYSSQRSSAF
jgi:hypothetical protein